MNEQERNAKPVSAPEAGEPALRECPFCGESEGRLWTVLRRDGSGIGDLVVRCGNCGAEGPVEPSVGSGREWNMRVPERAVDAARALELADALKWMVADGCHSREEVATAHEAAALLRRAAPAPLDRELSLHPIDQVDGDGMCLPACVASLTDVPISAWPPSLPMDAPGFWDAIYGALGPRGWELARTGQAPAGYAIADGDGPRGVRHSVVVKDGEIVHDPHPSRAGLLNRVCYFIPVRLAVVVSADER